MGIKPYTSCYSLFSGSTRRLLTVLNGPPNLLMACLTRGRCQLQTSLIGPLPVNGLFLRPFITVFCRLFEPTLDGKIGVPRSFVAPQCCSLTT